MPFKGKPKYEYKGTDYKKICYCLKKNPTKIAVIDDAGYLMTEQFMEGHSKPKSGSSTYDLYNDIADKFYDLIKFIKSLPEDQIVYVMMHEETSDFGDTKLKTIGKLLDQKVCIEGLSSIVLRCITLEKQHYFLTRTDGLDIVKTPEGLFSEEKIENDLALVDKSIREYYEIS